MYFSQVLLCVSAGDASINDAADASVCAEYESCPTCTGALECSWSSEEQRCADRTRATGNRTLMVENASRCPRFSVVYSGEMFGDHIKYAHRVKISNDLDDGFTSFVGRLRDISCCYDYTCGRTAATVADGYIVCDQTDYRPAADRLVYFSIVFNNIKLKFDDENDYYFTGDGRVADTDAAGCVNCVLFYGDSLSESKKWCPGDRHWPADPQPGSDTGPGRARTFGVTRVWCKGVTVRSVEPLYAPRSGGTAVTIAVTNHRAVAESCREIVVTAAGRPCTDVATPDNVTITCTVSLANGTGGPAYGPVKVVYVFPWTRYTVASAETFHLVEPAVTGFSPTCGPIDGDVRLTVTGVHLDAGNAFGVYVSNVGALESVPCETLWRTEGVAQCTPGPGTRDAQFRGLVEVEFDGAVRKYAVARPAVHVGQRLVGIVAGGTAVPVRGVHFSCTANTTSMFVVHDATRYYGRGCRATNDTHMVCQSPTLDPSVAGSHLELGFRTRFANHVSDLYPVSNCDYYAAPDPAYTDFETDNGTVMVINGPAPTAETDDGRPIGYDAADVTVRFNHNPQTADAELRCPVTSATRHRIVCVSDWPLYTADSVHVTVGSVFTSRVLRKPVQYSSELSTVFRAVVAVFAFVLCAGIVFMGAFCLKTNRRYTVNVDRIAGSRSPSGSHPDAAAPKSDAVDVQDSTENDDL